MAMLVFWGTLIWLIVSLTETWSKPDAPSPRQSAEQVLAERLAVLILEDHIRGCVRDAINGDEPDEKVDELVTVTSRYVPGGR